MLLGHKCYREKISENKLNMKLAFERISSPFFFFGITDRWNESICLFHAWFGGDIRAFELKNNRPTKRNETEMNISNYTDLDFILFEEVSKIFDARLADTNCTR